MATPTSLSLMTTATPSAFAVIQFISTAQLESTTLPTMFAAATTRSTLGRSTTTDLLQMQGPTEARPGDQVGDWTSYYVGMCVVFEILNSWI